MSIEQDVMTPKLPAGTHDRGRRGFDRPVRVARRRRRPSVAGASLLLAWLHGGLAGIDTRAMTDCTP